MLRLSIFPEVNVQFDEIKLIRIANRAFGVNNESDPYTLMLFSNELYCLTDTSIQPLAIFSDVSNDNQRMNIMDVQVILTINSSEFIWASLISVRCIPSRLVNGMTKSSLLRNCKMCTMSIF